ncbi:MAG: TIGR03986 family CRISPR-associated RAMP protein [Calothrix sp. C42_A2020_038]|nr:TIGR03986 family CRISPR-associated RAMP protein [Calothrix sp. C42_A2020_038]
MLPRHLTNVPDNRKAVAPYNFVELPDKVVPAQLPLPPHNVYDSERYTGKIDCTLTTSSPLYIRCGLTKEEFECDTESKNLPDFFYTETASKVRKPVLPGSSLRGMLRSLVEIISFSKFDKVSEYQKFFFRAVAADKDDPLKDIYKNGLKKENLKAGYLVEKNDGWYIRPATDIEGKYFIYIKEKDIEGKINGFTYMRSLDYVPQYKQNISFEDFYTQNGRHCAKKISSDCTKFNTLGVLVASGNMLENANLDEQKREVKLKSKDGRKYHYLVGIPDSKPQLVKISDDAITAYCSALTNFQKAKSPYDNNPFDENSGVLKNGRVIFYSQLKSEEITLFGQSPNFRIPYIPKGKQTAASAVDFIPERLRDKSIIDIADAIFGFVRDKKQEDEKQQVRKGRIFISDAECLSNTDDIWWEKTANHVITPQILASPKATTFQHYLVQPESTQAQKIKLKHYASEPEEETVIRGHKLYWHKGSEPDIKHPNPSEVSETQKTEIKPIGIGVKFKFTINFENLSEVELGALMWVLDIAANEKYRLSLGMGKPLGMGAVKIEPNLYLSDRTSRYTQLFGENSWEISENLHEYAKYIEIFEQYILQELRKDEFYPRIDDFKKIPRIKMILEMLNWQANPDIDFLEKTRYMEIERKQQPRLGDDENEYKARRILPTPLDVKIREEFEIGQEVDAKVVSCEVKQVQKGKKTKPRTIITYEIEDSDCLSEAEVNNKELDLKIGLIEKVKIEKMEGRKIRKVKRMADE